MSIEFAAMAIDQSGQVYITGESNPIGPTSSIVTFKLSTSGNLEWDSVITGYKVQ